MAEPREPREPRIPKESPAFDADGRWTRTWIMYFQSLFDLAVKEAVRQAVAATEKALEECCAAAGESAPGAGAGGGVTGKGGPWQLIGFGVGDIGF